jgi:hypothetical protein
MLTTPASGVGSSGTASGRSIFERSSTLSGVQRSVPLTMVPVRRRVADLEMVEDSVPPLRSP